MNLYTINTGFFKLDGGAMFGVVPKVIWNKINPADENNLCNWAMRSLLIEEGNRLILIDNGIGDKQDAKFMGHYYLNGDDSLDKSLAMHGFHPDDITDVILTHLHFDHCGGSIKREGENLVPAFKNATFWSNERHWKWATEPNARERASFLKENILPIAESGQLKMVPVAETGTVPFDDVAGVSIRYAFGHTDAMMVPEIEVGGKTVVYMADLLPSPGHMPLPYVMAYDMFPLTSMEEKKAFLDEAAEKDYLLFFEHDPVNEICSLQKTEKGVRPKEVGKLSHFI
ncbi:MAG: MBL fold metallo-hydrolase [Chitinophagaceae bacterium]|nr:MBL fold metallo-hydrolase [Chitinophagaceae bacterium]